MNKENNLLQGSIFKGLTSFAVPILFSQLLQSLYGAVDMLIVGKFATTPDVSGVATGSGVMQTFTITLNCLALGVTVIVGREIGRGNKQNAGKAIGAGIVLFTMITAIMTALMTLTADWWAVFMHAPEEAVEETVEYLRICGFGMIFIIAYNLIGSIFRGIGDSKTPLITVFIASIVNVLGDLLLVKRFNLGAAGAAYATVFAQFFSVVASLIIVKKTSKDFPIEFKLSFIRFDKALIWEELKIGIPIALQDLLVGLSFMFIQLMINDMGLVESAAMGIGQKMASFIMLVPSSCSQAISVFTAQNMGANQPQRAREGRRTGIEISFAINILVFCVAFFKGDLLGSIFTKDPAVIEGVAYFLKSEAINCLISPLLFCTLGYFNGLGKTVLVMIQGLVGAFCVRIPMVYLVTKFVEHPTLFQVGLSTPCASLLQAILCMIVYFSMLKKEKNVLETEK